MKIASSALAIVIAVTAVAHAQAPEAEALFRQGRKLMKQKSYAAACDKFEASERLDPAIGTQLNLAHCREKNGQLASAWAMFVKATQTAKHNHDRKREAEAHARARGLEPRLVYLTITVPRPARIPGLVVRRNDTVVESALYDQPMPVDSDSYTIIAEAPGYQRWQQAISVGKVSKTIEVPQLDEVIVPPPASRPAAPPPAPAEPSMWTTRRKAAVVLGAVGIAAGVTGIAFGVHANSLESRSDALCPAGRCNDPAAFDLNSSARTSGLVANIGMIGGTALVAGAVVLWVTGDRKKPRDAVSIVPSIGPSSIALGGTF
jgi:hypothetical protein